MQTKELSIDEPLNEEEIEELFKYYRIFTIASGTENDEIKMFMYSKNISYN